MYCKHCKEFFNEREIQEHHIHPRFMDNPEGVGSKVQLCKKCHDILHNIIPSIIWKYVPKEQRGSCIEEVKAFSKAFGGFRD